MLATPPSLPGIGMAEGTPCRPPGLAITTRAASFPGWKGEEKYHHVQSFGKCHFLLSLLCFPGHWSQAGGISSVLWGWPLVMSLSFFLLAGSGETF